MMMDGMWCMLMMGFGIVGFLGLIVGGLYLLVRAVGGGHTRSSGDSGEARPSSKAAAILEERFARGEIDRDELEERRRALERF